MKRIIFLFTGVTLVATMVLINVVSGVAEEDSPTGNHTFFEDEPTFVDEPPFS